MDQTSARSDCRYGFLSVVKNECLGYCGGLLVLTANGRPLEFHCTAPVTANRAQQILYGSTLRPFLMCDQIGMTLIRTIEGGLDVVLVDDSDLQGLSESIHVPVVYVEKGEKSDTPDACTSGDNTGIELPVLPAESRTDELEQILNQFSNHLPLTEPFERIHQAIDEAHSEAA